MLTLPQDFSQFLAFIGTPVFAAWVVSQLLENWNVFQKLSSGRKVVTALGTSIVLALVSYALVQWTPPNIVQALAPVYSIVVGAVTAFISGQIYHNVTKTTDTGKG